MLSFKHIKPKIKNLGDYNTLADIKRDGLRIAYNRANDSYWLIEEEFLRPVIKSPRECRSIVVDPKDLKHKIFMCGKSREDMRGSHALRYIEWGESRGFDKRPSCSGRNRWWEVPDEKGNTFWGKEVRERIGAFCSTQPMYADCRLYLTEIEPLLQAILNSTLTAFMSEAMARNLGGGGGPRSMMVYEVQNLLVLNQSFIIHHKKEIVELLYKMGRELLKPIIEDIQQNPFRRALDAIIFDALGLTADEREAVYEAVSDLVRRRLEKARSV